TRSVQHAFSAAVKVFPNPSRGNITIQVPAVIGKYDLVLSDQHGNRLRQWLNESRSVFGINNLKQGIYLVTVHSHALASRFTQRIIVQ
ncbi:MAG: T9SS type A sorting domain-containing protein, partial [Bacteroidetes bacterium]|nr:T9SS type A sorting domain-containing protein [Bacteroidota bacterium]